MKKFFNVFLVMLTVCFSACLVSCDSDDDNNGKPSDNRIYVYSAYVNDNVFGLCDVSITLHSGDKSKVVKLNKSNGTLVNVDVKLNEQVLYTVPAYRFDFDNVDGNKGIDYTEADVTLKADAEDFVNSLDADKKIYFNTSYNYSKMEYSANGHYSIEQPNNVGHFDSTRENLLQEVNGAKIYTTLPKLFMTNLSKKK